MPPDHIHLRVNIPALSIYDPAYHKYEFKIIHKCPFDSVPILLVVIFCSASFNEGLSDKTIYR